MAAPYRSEAVRLTRLYRQTLCRCPKTPTIRRHCEGYNMLPWRQGAVVGSTLYQRSHSRTIYRNIERQAAPKVRSSPNDQATNIFARCSHRCCRDRRLCITDLACCEGEAGKRNNEHTTDVVVLSFHNVSSMLVVMMTVVAVVIDPMPVGPVV